MTWQILQTMEEFETVQVRLLSHEARYGQATAVNLSKQCVKGKTPVKPGPISE